MLIVELAQERAIKAVLRDSEVDQTQRVLKVCCTQLAEAAHTKTAHMNCFYEDFKTIKNKIVDVECIYAKNCFLN